MVSKALYFSGLIFWITWQNALAGELPKLIDEIRGSIVGIGSAIPARPESSVKPIVKFSGTGFVVGNGRQVITNNHVIPTNMDVGKDEGLAIFTGRGKAAKVRRALVVRRDQAHDLALLSIQGTPLPVMTLWDESVVREGTAVAFTGFPIGVVLGLYPVTHQGIISAVTPIVIPAISSRALTARQLKTMRDPFEVYQLDAIAYPGNSGSPVYGLDTGAVIGVLNSVFVKETKETVLERPSGIAYAIPVKYVRKLLDGS
jgi:S1-C subfamily serine protease